MSTFGRIVTTLLVTPLVLTASGCGRNVEPPAEQVEGVSNAPFDSALAARLGADAYGMKPYVMAFLKSGPNRSQDSVQAAELQRAHLENINRMAEAGDLVLAGPFLDDGDIRGIYVFDVETVEEARALTETDPAVEAGRLVMELHPWYGSAALGQLGEIHERITADSP